MGQPTAPASPMVTGLLLEKSDPMMVLGLPGTDYRLHLVASVPVDAELDDRIRGTIRANARRVDVIQSGGRFIEPVFGRPRRIQGRIMGGEVAANTIFVQCGAVVACKLMAGQKAADFAIGQLVSFDIERGAIFEPVQ